jgi:GxxExxY protein
VGADECAFRIGRAIIRIQKSFTTKTRRHNVRGGGIKQFAPISEREETIARDIVSAAFAVHKALGPGLLEGIYQACFGHELTKGGHVVRQQVKVPIHYDGIIFPEGLRLDTLVDELVICELKVAEIMHPVFTAQLLSYLKLTDKRLGFLINFNVPLIKHGIHRYVR